MRGCVARPGFDERPCRCREPVANADQSRLRRLGAGDEQVEFEAVAAAPVAAQERRVSDAAATEARERAAGTDSEKRRLRFSPQHQGVAAAGMEAQAEQAAERMSLYG